MNETTPTPTADQVAAFQRLDKILGDANLSFGDENWAEVRKFLPDALTNPQHVLPTEPGLYAPQTAPDSAWKLHENGDWWPPYQDYSAPLSEVQNAAPFSRLVPERPQLAMSDLTNLVSIYCKEADSSGMPINLARAILALANGNPA